MQELEKQCANCSLPSCPKPWMRWFVTVSDLVCMHCRILKGRWKASAATLRSWTVSWAREVILSARSLSTCISAYMEPIYWENSITKRGRCRWIVIFLHVTTKRCCMLFGEHAITVRGPHSRFHRPHFTL